MKRSVEDENDTSTIAVSLDEFLPVDAREDAGDLEVFEERAVEEALHTVDPFVDADRLETTRVVAHAVEVEERHGTWTEVAEETADEEDDEPPVEEHEPAVDEVLVATTEGEDPARVHDWADAEDEVAAAETADDELPEPRHGDEFLCRVCFQLKHVNLRAEPEVCRDCAGSAILSRTATR